MPARQACVLAVLAAHAAAAGAAPVTYFGYLNGSAEVPPNGSAATGFALITVDDVAHTMHVTATFSGLSATATAAHIHCCTSEVVLTAGVATTTPSFTDFPFTTAGSYSYEFDMTSATSYSPGWLAANGSTPAFAEAALVYGISQQAAYFNIHTFNFPGGEIRSTLHPDAIFRNGMESP